MARHCTVGVLSKLITMIKYAMVDIKSYANSNIVRAKRGDTLNVFRVDGLIAFCVNSENGVAFTTTMDNLSDDYVEGAPPESNNAKQYVRKK